MVARVRRRRGEPARYVKPSIGQRGVDTMSGPNADLLQSLEHAVEQVRRLTQVAQQLIDAMQRGERLADSTLADYAAQLQNVTTDTSRMEELIRALWQMHGR